MVEQNNPIVADISIVTDGLEFMRDEFLARQGLSAEKFLTACYINGVELWEGQRRNVHEQIDEAGGIKSIKTRGPRNSWNGVKCQDGSRIMLSSILAPQPVALSLPSDAPTFPLLKSVQEAAIQLSFGGNSVRAIQAFNSQRDLDYSELLESGDIEFILSEEYRPTQIGLTEAVLTTSQTENASMLSAHRYQLLGRMWGAKLKDAFAPSPYDQPGAYADWRAEKPLPRLDIVFQATQDPERSNYGLHFPYLPSHPRLQSYFSRTSMERITLEGVEKMTRMHSLLNMLWKLEHGTDMPMPVDNALLPSTRELPA